MGYVVPEGVCQPVSAEVEDLRVLAHGGDGDEGGVDALHRLLAALPLTDAVLGTVAISRGFLKNKSAFRIKST